MTYHVIGLCLLITDNVNAAIIAALKLASYCAYSTLIYRLGVATKN